VVGLFDLFEFGLVFLHQAFGPFALFLAHGLFLHLEPLFAFLNIILHFRMFGDLDALLEEFARLLRFSFFKQLHGAVIIFAGLFFAQLIAFVNGLLFDFFVDLLDVFLGFFDELAQIVNVTGLIVALRGGRGRNRCGRSGRVIRWNRILGEN